MNSARSAGGLLSTIAYLVIMSHVKRQCAYQTKIYSHTIIASLVGDVSKSTANLHNILLYTMTHYYIARIKVGCRFAHAADSRQMGVRGALIRLRRRWRGVNVFFILWCYENINILVLLLTSSFWYYCVTVALDIPAVLIKLNYFHGIRMPGFSEQ